MRWYLHSLALVIFLCASPAIAEEFLKGADISFLPRVEAGGGSFRTDGVPQDLLDILVAGDWNTVRLRLWHSPADGHSGLAETLALAKRADTAGLDLLLDIHYSDTWADPGHQTKPEAWAHLAPTVLRDSIRTYTRDVLREFAARDLTPSIIQIGNEITGGILWNEGRVDGPFDNPDQWEKLASLLQAAIAGIDDAVPDELRPKIMIHIDRGGDNAGAAWFFDHLLDVGVEFEMIGLSYYPWWHGTLEEFEANLHDLALRYDKDLVVVETAYPWTLGWFDDTHNLVGLEDHLLPGYPASPEGQRAFFTQVLKVVHSTPKGRGRGVFWWAPEWISAEGFGSSWENLALFDEKGNALPNLLD